MKNILSLCGIVTFFLFSVFNTYASGTNRLNAFIEREKLNAEFIEINNLWQTIPGSSETKTDAYVKHADFLTLDIALLNEFVKKDYHAIYLTIPFSGQDFIIRLSRYDYFSSDFKVQTIANGKAEDYNYTPGLYYSGDVEGIPGSVAAFSFVNNRVYGIFSIPEVGIGNYVLSLNTLLNDPGNQYILYNDADLKINPAGGCGTDKLPDFKKIREPGASQKNVYSTCKDFEVYFLADYSTYESANFNVNNVVGYLTSVYNITATLYRNEGVFTSIKLIQINTTHDVYETLWDESFYFLEEFATNTQNNLNGADIAMLVSTNYGYLGGVAYLDVLCEPYFYDPNWDLHYGPYAFANIVGSSSAPTFPVYNWDVNMITHELGHNIGSPHTHSCLWPGGAIDGCYQLEDGPCATPNPQYPANGGTIMSYCHLVSGVGVNFSNGFGTLPGNLIRNNIAIRPCVTPYLVNRPISTTAKTALANRECTDANNITYYWNDNNNLNKNDDLLVLKIKKNNNNIGSLDNIGFDVRSVTNFGFGTQNGVKLIFPSGVTVVSDSAYASRRYWKMTPTTQPLTATEVIFPFTKTDSSDIHKSKPGPFGIQNLQVYNLKSSTIHPNPSNGLAGATVNDLDFYSYSTSPSANNWSLTSGDSVLFAHFLTNQLNGGAIFMNAGIPASANEIASMDPIKIYPNPAHDFWIFEVPASPGILTLAIYSIDGRLVSIKNLDQNKANEISASFLSAGLYYFRITGNKNVYTGTLQKK